MNAAVAAYARKHHVEEIGRIGTAVDLVLWGGVPSSKRAWTEEPGALVMIVNELAPGFDNVLLILDGWTSTVAKAAPAGLYASGKLLMEQISERAASNVECISLVGADPVRKIALASIVAFFAIGHATASMYLARIVGRSGVSHISNAARATVLANSVHANKMWVPAADVRDIDPGREIGRNS